MTDQPNKEPNETDDLTEAERIVEEAAGEDAPPIDGELLPVDLDPLAVAKQKARWMVRMLERLVRLKEPRIHYPEPVYEQAEEQLAPVLHKYDLSESALFKYSEETDALAFLGGLGVDSIMEIRAYREADKAAAEKARKQDQHGTQSTS